VSNHPGIHWRARSVIGVSHLEPEPLPTEALLDEVPLPGVFTR
jgi:hypothetical protein